MIHLALVNEAQQATYTRSGLPSVDVLAEALNRHLQDVAAAWGLRASVTAYRRTTIPAHAWPVVLLDDDPTVDASAAAWHEMAGGRPASYVPLARVIEYGMSPTVSASHETAEMAVDPWCKLTFDLGKVEYGAEVCDPVEAEEHAYTVNGLLMSDFVYPSWFGMPELSPGVYDHTKACKQPLEITRGGYASIRFVGSARWQQAMNGSSARQELSHRIDNRNAHGNNGTEIVGAI